MQTPKPFPVVALAAACLWSFMASANLTAQSMETSNGCQDTTNDPCIRTGTCSIQQTTWEQSVVVDRSDPYDQIGWTGL